jgi:hypothetical protein
VSCWRLIDERLAISVLCHLMLWSYAPLCSLPFHGHLGRRWPPTCLLFALVLSAFPTHYPFFLFSLHCSTFFTRKPSTKPSNTRTGSSHFVHRYFFIQSIQSIHPSTAFFYISCYFSTYVCVCSDRCSVSICVGLQETSDVLRG